MDFGLTIPTRGPLATPESVAAFARRAEELGFSHLAVPDHVVVPRAIDSRYPYSASGEFPGAASGACFDQFTLLAYIAAINTTARLLTSVTVIPHRGAVHTAKIVATIDVLSHGRMILERGRVTDEYLMAFKSLWTEDKPSFEGDHVRFGNITFLPKPVQKPHPPIWVGGESPAALRRTARLGDVWFPIGNNPRHPLDTMARFADGIANMRAVAEKHGRDPGDIGLAFFANWFDEAKTATTADGQRLLLTGSAEQIAEDIGGFSELGVTDLTLNFQRDTLEQSLDSMQHFADVIRPSVAS
jgi:alkanesulfonate monooxygenase SsuD/methylene tetrahydromethanopterin reductase-like flavin-dependent oxidoreductase (luciferase family)